MFDFLRRKTIFTARKKYCTRCYELLKWKYRDSGGYIRKSVECCSHYYVLWHNEHESSETINSGGKFMRLL